VPHDPPTSFALNEGMEGRKNTNKTIRKQENVIRNKIYDFFKSKFHYKPTCEVGSV
jgi:hypothetical protein